LKDRRTTGSVLLLLSLLTVSACTRDSAGQSFAEREAVPVLVAKAEQKTVATRIRAIGRVEAYSTVEIKAQVSGQVIEVDFKEGQEVKKGDLLFKIDQRPFQAALSQARAALSKSEAQLAQAVADERRWAMLLKESVGSPQQYDQAHANAESLRATVASDQAAAQAAELNLAYTTIHAPIDGRTGNLLVHSGNLVKANADNAMVTINQLKPVYVDFSIPEQRLSEVRRYMADRKLPVDTAIPGPQSIVESGVLSFVDNAVDAKTGTIELKGIFSNEDGKLWPGQFVETTLVLDERPNTVLVPSQAIQTGPDGSYVFVIDKQMKAQARPVVIGENYDAETIVERGITPGETVVTDGQLRLVPGSTVTIKRGLKAESGVAS
jgi:multidrug efflux system membrane fusion protein